MTSLADLDSADVVVLERDSQTKCRVHLFGATLISWTSNNEEYIFVSSKAKFDNKSAIRGGIPIVFPNFGPWSTGPQHGFARITRWQLEQAPVKDDASGDVVAVFSLQESEETLKMWNYKFKLLYTVTLLENSLKTSLTVVNNSLIPFSFTCLLHTYFRVPDVAKATVSNLRGLQYSDRTQNGEVKTEDRDVVPIDRFIDYTYSCSPAEHEITGVTGNRTIKLLKSNFPDTVVWNPWSEKSVAMSDLGADYVHMLCVEAGHVSSAVEVAPNGGVFEAYQLLTIP